MIAQTDEADTILRQPAHQGAVTRQPASMPNDVTEAAILRDSKTIRITRDSELKRRVDGRTERAGWLSAPGLLHLTRATPFDWTTIRLIARRKRRHQKGNVSREIVCVGPKSAHRSK